MCVCVCARAPQNGGALAPLYIWTGFQVEIGLCFRDVPFLLL